jgi:hypothetical protein
MSYLVICTFDLKNANHQDYQNAYADLAKIGLNKIIVGSQGGRVVTPTTTTAGEFNGNSAASVCNDIRAQVKSIFAARRFSSEIFVMVGGDWAWGATTT